MAGGGFHEVGESKLGRGSMHSKGVGTIRASPLHSCDFAPLMSYLSAIISHYTGVPRASPEDGEIKGRMFLRSSGRLGRETVGSKQLSG